MSTMPASEATREAVRQRYAGIVTDTMGDTSEASGGSCCGAESLDATTLAASIGYRIGELSTLPEEANMGLSCGNPIAIAAPQRGGHRDA